MRWGLGTFFARCFEMMMARRPRFRHERRFQERAQACCKMKCVRSKGRPNSMV
jgi:hypothetical protein